MNKAENLRVLAEKGFYVPRFTYLRKNELKNPENFKVGFESEQYAVRSSYSSEGTNGALTGIFRSYGPIKREEVPEHIKQVASEIDKAAEYLEKKGLPRDYLSKIEPGVMVQEYINCEKGGVCFTDYMGSIVIETGKSPSDVTSGRHVNSRYIIPRSILRTDTEDKETINGVISDSLAIEGIFKRPQSIEWGLANNKTCIFQTVDMVFHNDGVWSNPSDFVASLDSTAQNAYTVFSFSNSQEFRADSYNAIQNILHLKPFAWKQYVRKAYRTPINKDPVMAYKEAVINNAFFSFVSQLPEDNSLAMRNVKLAMKSLDVSLEDLTQYARSRVPSFYSKIVDNPRKYEKTFDDRNVQVEGELRRPNNAEGVNLSGRAKELAEFFTMLYEIKNYRGLYHDYKISPHSSYYFKQLPKNITDGTQNFNEIFMRIGITLPDIKFTNMEGQIPKVTFILPHAINGVVGDDIIVAKDVPPETVLKVENVKCILSQEGGLLSHASILAHEFGIPFVAGINDLTKMLNRNDKVSIEKAGDTIIINNLTKGITIEV